VITPAVSSLSVPTSNPNPPHHGSTAEFETVLTPPFDGVDVNFTLTSPNGVVTVVTVQTVNGIAATQPMSITRPGSWTVKVHYNGDACFAPASNTVTLSASLIATTDESAVNGAQSSGSGAATAALSTGAIVALVVVPVGVAVLAVVYVWWRCTVSRREAASRAVAAKQQATAAHTSPRSKPNARPNPMAAPAAEQAADAAEVPPVDAIDLGDVSVDVDARHVAVPMSTPLPATVATPPAEAN